VFDTQQSAACSKDVSWYMLTHPSPPARNKSQQAFGQHSYALVSEELNLDRRALAIYMGKAAAANIIPTRLDGPTSVLLIENTSLPAQRLLNTRLDLLA
jgi:siroheme synthase